MKKIIMSIVVAAVAVSMVGCGNTLKSKETSQGGVYELYVVCDETNWKGMLGDTLREIFLEPVPMINQREPHFDMVRIAPNGYTGLIPKCRNQLIVKTGAEYDKPSMTAVYDVYARPQIIVTITAATSTELTQYVTEHREKLLRVFMMAERDRDVALNKTYYEKGLSGEVEKQFGFKMNVPKGYTMRNQKDNFMWMSYEMPHSSMGIVIYSYPYSGKDNFTVEQLVERRNEFTALIPGPSDGSHMTTADVEPDIAYQRINGRLWAMMRGFWDVKGDFMGGPFVSYATVDLATNKVVVIDCYLFSPKQNKRNYLRQLEHVIYTVSFPGDAQQELEAEDGN